MFVRQWHFLTHRNRGRKRKQIEDSEEDMTPPPEKEEMLPIPPQDTDNPDRGEMEPTPPQDIQDRVEKEEAEAGSSSPMPDIKRLQIGMARQDRKMKSLLRSLQMKKVNHCLPATLPAVLPLPGLTGGGWGWDIDEPPEVLSLEVSSSKCLHHVDLCKSHVI